MSVFTWVRTSDARSLGICRMRVPTVLAKVSLWQQVQLAERGIAEPIPMARVELAMQINGPDAPPSNDTEHVVWQLQCFVEASALDDDGVCEQCHGVGRYVALPGDEIAACPYCLGCGRDLLSKGQAVADALLDGKIMHKVLGAHEPVTQG